MSLGKPCVVTDAGGNPEIIQQGINGLVTKNGDEEEFAVAIIRLMDDRVLYTQAEKAAVEIFQQLFHARIMNQKFFHVYKML